MPCLFFYPYFFKREFTMKKVCYLSIFAALLITLLSNASWGASNCIDSCSSTCGGGCPVYGLWGNGFTNDLSLDGWEINDGVDHEKSSYKSSSRGFTLGVEREVNNTTLGLGYLYADTAIDALFADLIDPANDNTSRLYNMSSNLLFVSAEKEFKRWQLSGLAGASWSELYGSEFLDPDVKSTTQSFVLNFEAKMNVIEKSSFRLSPVFALTLFNTNIEHSSPAAWAGTFDYQTTFGVYDAAVDMRWLAHRNFLVYSRMGYRFLSGVQNAFSSLYEIYPEVHLYQPQNLFRLDVGIEWQLTSCLKLEGGYLLRAGEYNFESHSFLASLTWKLPTKSNSLLRGQRYGTSRFGKQKTNWSERIIDCFNSGTTGFLNIFNANYGIGVT